MSKYSTYPLVKLPVKIELVLFLIKEELKARKLFNILRKIGVNECAFEPHLDSLILQTFCLDEDDDSITDKYFDIMEKRSKRIDSDSNGMMKQALKAYQEIMAIKRG